MIVVGIVFKSVSTTVELLVGADGTPDAVTTANPLPSNGWVCRAWFLCNGAKNEEDATAAQVACPEFDGTE